MRILSIKVPIRKKSGNLSYAPRYLCVEEKIQIMLYPDPDKLLNQ